MSAQTVDNQQKADVRDEILEHLKKEERTLAWLAKKTNIPYGTLYSIFTHRVIQLRQDRLDSINKVFNTDFKFAEESPAPEQQGE